MSETLIPDPRSLIPELRDFLKERLPDYMVPSAFVALDALPLTTNGKVNQRALPLPDPALMRDEQAFVAPRTPTEELLAGIWAQVLGVERVGLDDNFFALGGHSLLATQAVARIREIFQVELPLANLFEAPSLGALAARVEQARRSSTGRVAPAIRPAPRGGALPLSFAQQRLWFLDQLTPGSAAYNIPTAVRLAGALDVAGLRESLAAIIRRHEALRTRFTTNAGSPVQVIDAPDTAGTAAPNRAGTGAAPNRAGTGAAPLLDLRGLPADMREDAARRIVEVEAALPFDLARGPLLRTTLLRLGDDAHLLLLTVHHIIADGWSMGVLVRELAALYHAAVTRQPAALPKLPIQYADYALWQREWLHSADDGQPTPLQGELAFWQAQLADAPTALALPTDHPRPPLQSQRGASYDAVIAPALRDDLLALSRHEGVTLFMTLLAGFQTLLARYSGQTDLLVGSPIANRTRVELEELIGFFVNTLVLRGDLSGDPSVRALLRRTRVRTLAAYAHQDLPFEQLVETLQPQRDMGMPPLVQVLFALQNAPLPPLALDGLTLQPQTVASATARVDLTVVLFETSDGLQMSWEYSADLFDTETITRMAGHFSNLLAGMCADPGRAITLLPLLARAEQQQLLVDWNATAVAYPREACIHELFELQVARTPDAVAILFDETNNERGTVKDESRGEACLARTHHLSYAELNGRANRLAHYLRALGIEPDARVGILMDREPALLVAILGVLKAGGAYVPLDPAYPAERIVFMLEDSGAAMVLMNDEGRTTKHESLAFVLRHSSFVNLRADWPSIAQAPDCNPQPRTSADNLAYVIYTSGSTGTPKGAAIPHRGVTRLVCGATYARLDATRTLLQMAPISFDASTLEIWGALANGARCVLYAERVPTADGIQRALKQFGVSTLWLTAALFNAVIDQDPMALAGVEELLVGGEALSAAHVRRALRLLPRTRLINGYGPTESTTFACCYPIPRTSVPGEASFPIGRPIGNTTVYLLDRALQPVPIGVAGELHIGGDGLARGYLDRSDLTAARFIPNPFAATKDEGRKTKDESEPSSLVIRPSSRLYRTGDLARYHADGAIEFLGRIDGQVKLRGYRIELGEIEALLRSHPAVRDAVALAREDAPPAGGYPDKRLVAYVVPATNDERRMANDEFDASSFVVRPSSFVTELRKFLAARLPEYMLPSAFMVLDALPLTLNGKLDRRALPAPDAARPELDGAFVAPRTPTEATLAGIWAGVLHLDRVGVHDNFFALGGHSLLATQVVERVREVCAVELPLRALFEAPTIAGLAARIESARGDGLIAQAPPILPVARTGELPLAFAQQRMWFLDQLQPGGFAYNLPAAIRMSGPLDLNVFRRSLNAIVQRHEALRTTFAAAEGRPIQVIAPALRLALPLVDLRNFSPQERERLTAQHATAEARRPFDLARGPLLRATLLRLADAEHMLLFTMHHIVSDGWSIGLFIRELVAIFEAFSAGATPQLAALPLQYADYAYWQRQWLQGAVLEEQLAYWKRQLAGADGHAESPVQLRDRVGPPTLGGHGGPPTLGGHGGPPTLGGHGGPPTLGGHGGPPTLGGHGGPPTLGGHGGPPLLDLPTDRPRPAVQTFRGGYRPLAIRGDLVAALQELSRREGATLFMTLLAAFATLLHRYSAQDDMLIGTPIAGRTRAEIEDLIGCFVNTLVLRTDLTGNPSFSELAGRVRETALSAYAHQDLPFEQLVDALQPERDLSRNPLFQVLFALHNTSVPALRLPGLTMTPLDVHGGAAQFDLALSLTERPDGISGELAYSTDLFDDTTIARLARHFSGLLEGIVVEPGRPIADLRFLPAPERQQLLDWNATQTAYAHDLTIPQLFEAQVARTPDAVAVVFEDQQLSYAVLNTRANRLAHHLRALGVGPEARVGLCLERSAELLIGLLGILKAGGAYVPLDPRYPGERLRYMLEDSGARVIVTNDERRTTNDDMQSADYQLPAAKTAQLVSLSACQLVNLETEWPAIARRPASNPRGGATPANLAYVIYTSGSTGRPKGVMIPHRNAANFFAGMDARIGGAPGTWLAVTSVSFDISILELLWTLTRGFRVIVQDEQQGSSRHAERTSALATQPIEFSLFYFGSADGTNDQEIYRLLMEGARFADAHGFAAVWTPERHFHAFGGLYPNPAVLGAALAASTQRIRIRAGSVVLPLHNPIRVAEEWAVVDNLSRGRVGLSFASGWHADDFVFAPERYRERREIMLRQIETVRALWRGEAQPFEGGAGNTVEVRILPRPIQPELPFWLTAAGSPETFRNAGAIGANLLTHLLGQSLEELAEKIAAYRAAWREQGHAGGGHVTLMLHTFVGTDLAAISDKVREPFRNYLRTSVGLLQGLARSLGHDPSSSDFTESDMQALLDHAVERYFATSGLFGTPESCLEMIDRLKLIGVDEVACLVDFGVDVDAVIASFRHLNRLRELSNPAPGAANADYSLGAQLRRQAVTHLQCTPSLASMLLTDPAARSALGGVRTLLLGGEALPEALVEQLRAVTAASIHNMYGPTETTIWSSTQRIAREIMPVTIGRPIANTTLYILDRAGQSAPIGVAGDLLIGGEGLAHGYLERPDLTAERFVPNPFAVSSTQFAVGSMSPNGGWRLATGDWRLYRTGDRARYLADGRIEFLGRADQQIKLRGYRIELGEIAAALARHPAVRDAVAVLRENRLVAYVVQGAGVRSQELDDPASEILIPEPRSLIPELREFLVARLPDYMIPATFVLLDALPLTPNGKLDRRALPAPSAPMDAGSAFVAPRTPEESLLAEIWAGVLHVERVGVHDNFFTLGGHSLLATQLVSRVRESFQVELPLRRLFEAPTVAGLAEWIASTRRDPRDAILPPITPAPRDGALPLSFAQQRLWFIDQMQPDSSAYNVPSAMRLSGALDLCAVKRSLNAIVERHESLRASFVAVDGEPRQVFAATLDVPLRVLDLRDLPASARELAVQQIDLTEAQRRFDLSRDQLLRASLLRLDEQSHILLLTMHHVVADIWSTGVLIRDLSAFYAAYTSGQAPELPALPVQYADFALWQRTWLQGARLDAQLAFWRRSLAGAPPLLDLPTDYPRPAVQSFHGAVLPFTLDAALTTRLHALSREAGVTLFMTLLSAFQVLLARYSGQDDIVVGSPIANRTRTEIEDLIGFFANTLVLRGDLRGNPTLRELLARVRSTALDAYAHQDLPFEQLVEALQPQRDLRYAPLFQVLFVLENAPLPALTLAGLELTPLRPASQTAKFDLTLLLEERAGILEGMVEYSTELFTEARMARLVAHYRELLEHLDAHLERPIGELALLTAAERQQMLVDWNGTQMPHPQGQCLHQLLEAQADRTPDAVAVIFAGAHLTYEGIDRRANQLARYLSGLGVGPDVPVGLWMNRSLELMVGVLGILKAGGAYLPLDPAYPEERVAFMLKDSGAQVLVTNDEGRRTNDGASERENGRTGDEEIQMLAFPRSPLLRFSGSIIDLVADWPRIAEQPAARPANAATPANLAYVIYTSGSTGRPKGIAIEHRSAVALVHWCNTIYSEADLANVLASTSICFDHSFFELFVPMSRGGTITVVENVLELLDLPAASAITLIHTVPSAIATLLQTNSIPSAVRTVNLAGEPLQTQLVQQLYQRTNITRVLDLYGPSEVTVYSTAALRAGSGSATIGRPIHNIQIYLLDATMQPVPLGIAGELYIGGHGLARGYYRRPDMTAERFVPNPFSQGSGVRGQGSGVRGQKSGVRRRTMNDQRPTTNGEWQGADCRLPTADCRLYRTGDLGRYLPDGRIEFLGRVDHQIKLRGFRIELAEIETVLREHPGVYDAVALVRQDATGDKRLIAYIVQGSGVRSQGSDDPASETLIPDPRPLIPELRGFLKRRLPDFMLPDAFVALDALPLTPNGKLDRKALPLPERDEAELAVAYVAPRTPTEELVAAIWAQVLDSSRVGVYENFFALGGHSLLATQVVSKVRNAFQIELPLRALFEAPTVAELAGRIDTALRSAPGLQAPPLLPAPRDEAPPLSFAQQRLWFFQQLEPGNAFYNIPAALRLSGSLDIVALARSLGAIIARHETLRTSFASVMGTPKQVIAPVEQGARALPLWVIDLGGLAADAREGAARRLAETEARAPFDLAAAPLFRVAVVRVGPAEHVLLLTMHHIISDAWSMGVLIRELTALYAGSRSGRAPALPALPIQYADFALWQRRWLQGEGDHGDSPLQTQLAYWKERLAGAPPLLDLPTDFPRPAVQSFRGAALPFTLDAALTARLHALSREAGVTPFMTLLSAFEMLLARYSGQDDIVVGSPIANRTRAEVEGLIGFFVNTLVLRADLRGNPTLRELLARVRSTALDAYAHQDLPFEQLVEALAPDRDLRYAPLVQVLFVLENAPLPALTLAGLELTPLPPASQAAKFDLTLLLEERAGTLEGVIEYSTELFTAARMARLAAHYRELLAQFAAQLERPIGALALLTTAERQQLLVDWGTRQAAYPGESVLQRFAAQAARTPDAVALVFDAEMTKNEGRRTKDGRGTGEACLALAQHLTYRELNARANRLAHYLRGLGVGPEARVGLCVERSLDLAVGLLGIWKAGGVYVPLDAGYPPERLAFMLEDAQVRVLVSASAERESGRAGEGEQGACLLSRSPLLPFSPNIVDLRADWPAIAQASAADPAGDVRADQLAYLIYTSGSTGRPKAVMVEHRNLLNTLAASQEQFGFRPGDTMPAIASVAFDIALFELLNPLLAGGTVVLLSRAQVLDLPYLRAALARCTVFHAVPGLMQQIVQAAPGSDARAYANLRLVFVGGDAVPTALPAQIQAAFPRADICILYGPTEAAIICTRALIPRGRRVDRALLGMPLPNVQALLLDHHRQPAPLGIAGELYLGGAGLARGYLGRPELTAERFIPNPFAATNDERRTTNDEDSDQAFVLRPSSFGRLYRTGDRARWLADGTLEFLGRIDDQVKVRGVRVELGEVEAALARHPAVREAVALMRGDRLVAYVVQESGVRGQGSGDSASEILIPDPRSLIPDLRDFLAQTLPDPMIPSAFVLLDALPRTPNGKVDRRGLPAPDDARPAIDTSFVAPRTPQEQVVAGIWAEVLGLAQVGLHDNFFALGGHSLLATQVIARLNTVFGLDIPLRRLFEAPTVAALAEQIALGRNGAGRAAKPPLLPARRDGVPPLSFAQQRLWFLDLLQPGNPAYNMPVAVRLAGSLNVAALHTSLRAIVARHEALRTTFAASDGRPVQLIAPVEQAGEAAAPLPIIDLRRLDTGRRAAELERLVADEAQRPFDLARGPLVRAALLRLDAATHVLLLTMHHIVSDGWSIGVAVRELAALYTAFVQGRPDPLPPLPIQYADYAIWQRGWLQGSALEEQLAYWRAQLGGADGRGEAPRLDLPTDRSHSADEAARGASESLALPQELSERLRLLGQREGATPFMILLAAFNILLGRYSGQEDIVVGAPIAGRNEVATEGLIGFFLNTLALRTDLAGAPSFQELLGRVREMLLGAYAHQDVPFEKLVEEMQPERSLERNPFFDVLFNFMNTPPAALELPGVELEVVDQREGGSKFWFTLYVAERAGAFDLQLTYQPRMFSAAYMATLLRQFAALLAQIAEHPEWPLRSYSLATADLRAALPDPAAALAEPSYDRLTAMFEQQVRRLPDHPAITQGERAWSYGELSAGAQQIARALLAHNLQAGEAVAVFGSRSFGVIAGMLGVLMAGGVLLPIDRNLPGNRQRVMIEAAGANLLLYVGEPRPEDAWLRERDGLTVLELERDSGRVLAEPSLPSATPPLPDLCGDGPAYIFFTSGTTGAPKGVLGRHSGLSHFLAWQREAFAIGPQDRCAQLTGLSFDVVLRDIFTPLTSGATLCLPTDDGPLGADQLVGWLARERISVIHTVPALAESWLANLASSAPLTSMRWAFFAGEPLADRLVKRWRAAFPQAGGIVNLYGPTETTLAKCFYQVPEEVLPGVQPVGRPLPHCQALVVADGERLCGVGELGEIVIRTPFRSLGYLNAPDEQRRRFVPNPFIQGSDWTDQVPDPRPLTPDPLYRTGDLGRYRADGLLEIVGRIDRQIKIRGIRVEPGEIEALLRRHPAVQQAAVLAHDGEAGELRLAAYVVPTKETGNRGQGTGDKEQENIAVASVSLSPADLRRFLKEHVPAAMIPAAFVLLDALPLTPNGKIDRRALPQPDWQRPERETEYVMPRGEVEQIIAAVWQEALGIEQVGVHDNFFDLGGHSLLIVQVQGRLRERLGQDIPLVKLFQYPTVSALAAHLGEQPEQGEQPTAVQKSQARSDLRKVAMNRRRRGAREE